MECVCPFCGQERQMRFFEFMSPTKLGSLKRSTPHQPIISKFRSLTFLLITAMVRFCIIVIKSVVLWGVLYYYQSLNHIN
jgi:hypothetical protein